MNAFDDVYKQVAGYEGWLRREQAAVLWAEAAALQPGATIVEIGSYHGKSTVILATAAPDKATVYAIDPHAGNDRGPGQWQGEAADGQADHDQFIAHLTTHGVRSRVTHVREFSQKAHLMIPGSVDLLYVDGAHGYRPALSDINGWGDRVVPGGTMAIHDVYTSFFVTLAVMRSLWFSREWTYVKRERSMAVYRRQSIDTSGVVRNAARQMRSMPWFIKNMAVKAAATVGLTKLAQRGHDPRGGLY